MKPFARLAAVWSAGALLTASFTVASHAGSKSGITLQPIGTYNAGIFNQGGAEIVAHDPSTQRLFVVNALNATVDVLAISNPASPAKIATVYFTAIGGVANGVAVHNGIIAVAVEANPKTDPGHVVLMDQALNTLAVLEVGAQPDMVTFSPNGRWVLTANEGEPNGYPPLAGAADPEGSVSIIDLSKGPANVTQADVRTADFRAFNSALLAPGIRIFGPGASVAQDLEPEYIAVSFDSRTAWVTLQENNALGIIDIESATVTELVGLGFKDHSHPGNGLDASDRDNAAGNGPAINIRPWPVFGMYQPDAIVAFMVAGRTYLAMANEGDGREWPNVRGPGTNDELARVSTLKLDPAAFPDQTLTNNSKLGRLQVTTMLGDANGDGQYEALYALGARSFSIRSATGELLWDSGDEIEQITALALLRTNALPFMVTNNFNASHSGAAGNAMDTRSPSKGPEPESIAIGRAFGRMLAFIALERVGGIMVYDVSNPRSPEFLLYVNRRDFTRAPTEPNVTTVGDLGPEGIIFIKPDDSPNGKPLVVIGNEVSSTTTIYELGRTP